VRALTAKERQIMCIGCLFAALFVTFPRVGLLIVWIFTPWVKLAFDGWFWPLLGLIFLPFTTLTYVLVDVATVGNINFGGWLLVGLAALIDISHWAQAAYNRQNGVALYNEYGPGHLGA
jgi:hypothetical protein